MDIDVEVIFKVIAYGIPALLIMGGMVLLFIGLPLDHVKMIHDAWLLIGLGVAIYFIEIIVKFVSDNIDRFQ